MVWRASGARTRSRSALQRGAARRPRSQVRKSPARLKDPGFPVASPPSRLLSELPGRPSRFLPGGAPRSGRGGPSRRREATRKDPQATRKRPARPSRILPAETTHPAPLHAAPRIRATFLARPGREEGARPMSCKNRSDSKGKAAPRRERRSPGRGAAGKGREGAFPAPGRPFPAAGRAFPAPRRGAHL